MLKIKELDKSYGSYKVLNNLEMTVNKGDVYGFLGKNGCGKTTTMNIVANIIPKDRGIIEFESETKKIGYLPETPMLFPYMNGYEYLDYIAGCCNYKGDVKKRIDEVLELTGLKDGAKRRIKGYSRGMNQRLGIAGSIFHDPDLLILDEPTSALDPQGRAEVMNIINRLSERGTTIILCTHILSDVERVANRIGILSNGRLAIEGTLDEIKEKSPLAAKRIEVSFFDGPQKAVPVISPFCQGKFYLDSKTGKIRIPMDKNADEKAEAERFLKLVQENNLLMSEFLVTGGSLEEIYLSLTANGGAK